MLVRDIMATPPVTVQATDTLRIAIDRMAERSCRRLPVVDDSGRLVGVITDRDVRLAMNSPLVMRERWQDEMLLEHTEVDACMSENPFTIGPDAPLQQAIDLLLEHKISGLPVTEGQHLVGIITVTDLLLALKHLLNELQDESQDAS